MKLISWNVEHSPARYKVTEKGRLGRVVDAIREEHPDLFALIEVVGRHVFTALVRAFPG